MATIDRSRIELNFSHFYPIKKPYLHFFDLHKKPTKQKDVFVKIIGREANRLRALKTVFKYKRDRTKISTVLQKAITTRVRLFGAFESKSSSKTDKVVKNYVDSLSVLTAPETWKQHDNELYQYETKTINYLIIKGRANRVPLGKLQRRRVLKTNTTVF